VTLVERRHIEWSLRAKPWHSVRKREPKTFPKERGRLWEMKGRLF